jgi:hypothetical protein
MPALIGCFVLLLSLAPGLGCPGALAQTSVFYDDFTDCTNAADPNPAKWDVSVRQWVRAATSPTPAPTVSSIS